MSIVAAISSTVIASIRRRTNTRRSRGVQTIEQGDTASLSKSRDSKSDASEEEVGRRFGLEERKPAAHLSAAQLGLQHADGERVDEAAQALRIAKGLAPCGTRARTPPGRCLRPRSASPGIVPRSATPSGQSGARSRRSPTVHRRSGPRRGRRREHARHRPGTTAHLIDGFARRGGWSFGASGSFSCPRT